MRVASCQKSCLRRRQLLSLSSSSSSSSCHVMPCHHTGVCWPLRDGRKDCGDRAESSRIGVARENSTSLGSVAERDGLAKRRPRRRRLWARAARIRACGVTVRTDVPRKDCGHRAGARRHGQLLGVVERGDVVGHGPSPCKLHGLDPQPTTAQARRQWRSNARIRRC
jgi:hypothetical protein